MKIPLHPYQEHSSSQFGKPAKVNLILGLWRKLDDGMGNIAHPKQRSLPRFLVWY
jgi:hypothetical protein